MSRPGIGEYDALSKAIAVSAAVDSPTNLATIEVQLLAGDSLPFRSVGLTPDDVDELIGWLESARDRVRGWVQE